METEHGKLLGGAIRAVLDMQADCIRLFRDLDERLVDLQPVAGMENLVTTDLGSSINNKQLFVAQYLFRLYSRPDACHHVLGINICFHDRPKHYFPEPLFIAANTIYTEVKPDRNEELMRAWDPWSAWFNWAKVQTPGEPLEVSQRRRSTIERIVIAAVPLFLISSIEEALRIIDLVGRP